MNLYLDTSSLAKLYIEEEGSSFAREAVQEAEMVATSIISYAEIWSLAGRRQREKLLTKPEAKRFLEVFESDWSHIGKLGVDMLVLKRAGKLLMKHPLRSLDAIHLASALAFRDAMDEPISFFSADKRLQTAAQKEKLHLL